MVVLESRIRSRIENVWASAILQAGIIYSRLDNNPKIERVLKRVELPIGRAIRIFGFTDGVEVDNGNEALNSAWEHLKHGALIVASPFHRYVTDAIPTIQIIEALFTGHLDPDCHVWPWSYKFMAELIHGLAPRQPLLQRIGARGLAEASNIKQVFVVQPKYRQGHETPNNIDRLNQLEKESKETLIQYLGQEKTLVHLYVTGTRQDTGKLERPQRTGLAFYLRNPNVVLLPITHSLKKEGRKKVLRVNIGGLISGKDVRRFERAHEWSSQIKEGEGRSERDTKFNFDDALMALIAETTVLPRQKNGVDPRGIYKSKNYQKIVGLGK